MSALASLFLDPDPVEWLRGAWPSLLTTDGCEVNGQPVRPSRPYYPPFVPPVKARRQAVMR